MSKRNNNFLVQGSILAAASIIVRIIGFIYRIPMTRIIGDEGMGFYGPAFEIYNITLILSSYSLPIAVSKLVAARGINKEYRNSYRVFLCSMIFAVAVGLIATIILFFGADFFTSLINNDPDPMAGLPLKVLAPTIFIFSIMGVFRGFFQGKNTTVPTAISQILEQIVNAVVSVVASYIMMKNYSASLSVAAYGAAGGTLGTFLGAFAGLIFLAFVFSIYNPILKKQLRKDTSNRREGYGEIFKVILITISPIILSQTVYHISGLIDQSMFGHIMETKEVTLFDRAFFGDVLRGQLYSAENRRELISIYGNKYRTLTSLPVAVASAIGATIVTSISAAKAKGQEEIIKSKAYAAIKFNMIIAFPSAVGMGVLASPILRMLFGDASDLSANLLQLGSVAIVFYSLSTVSTSILQGIGRLKVPVINSAISLGIHIVLVFVLLKFTPLSTYALVIGNITFALVVSILNWISTAKYLHYSQEMIKTFVIPAVSSGFMGIAAFFIHMGIYAWTSSNVLAVLVAMVVAVMIYFLLLIFMKGLEEEELAGIPKGYAIIRILRRVHIL